MLNDYLPIVILLALAAVFAIGSLMAARFLAPRRPTPAKAYPYECGIIPERLPKGERFPVKFYVVAMLFIIFDIETVFMIPWAAGFRQLKDMTGLLVVEMFIFIAILAIGYVYIWKRGALEWD